MSPVFACLHNLAGDEVKRLIRSVAQTAATSSADDMELPFIIIIILPQPRQALLCQSDSSREYKVIQGNLA